MILTSNPRNPTGRVVKGKELKNIQDICRSRATLIMDEISHYNVLPSRLSLTVRLTSTAVISIRPDAMEAPYPLPLMLKMSTLMMY